MGWCVKLKGMGCSSKGWDFTQLGMDWSSKEMESIAQRRLAVAHLGIAQLRKWYSIAQVYCIGNRGRSIEMAEW